MRRERDGGREKAPTDASQVSGFALADGKSGTVHGRRRRSLGRSVACSAGPRLISTQMMDMVMDNQPLRVTKKI